MPTATHDAAPAAAAARTLKFAVCAGGIWGSFVAWGFLQERLASAEYVAADGTAERFDNSAVLNATLALCAALCAAAAMLVSGTGESLAPQPRFFTIGLCNTLASPCGYASLAYINFPVLVVAKASKLLPIMGMGVLLHGRRYGRLEYLSALLLTAGVAAFSLKAQSAEEAVGAAGERLAIGLGLVGLNLAMDGFTNSAQDNAYRETKASPWKMMYQVNVWGLLLLAGWLGGWAALGDWPGSAVGRAVAFAAAHPEIGRELLVFGMCGALGQLFIFVTIREFGSLACTTVCVLRKFSTVLISIVVFQHAMSVRQWWGLLGVFAGLSMNAFVRATAPTKVKDA